MKRVLFLTNYPSPYRVRFYDLMGKSLDVTVLCTDPVADITHRDKEWFESGEGNFQLVQLPKAREIRGEYLCTQVISWLKKPYDAIVICGYSSPTAMLAMSWLRLHRIPYYMEVDGGLIRQDSGAKFRFKRALVRHAKCWLSSGLAMSWLRLHRIPYYMEVDGGLIRQDSGAKFRFKRALVRHAKCWLSSGPHTTDYLVHYGADRMEVDGGLIRQDSGAKFRFKRALVRHAKCWLSSGPHTTDYLVHYGADRQRVWEYPFTSLYARDILPQAPTGEQKLALRRELGMGERKIVLYVGRFTREKGMDALLDAATALDGDTGVYFVGGEPTPAQLEFCEKENLSNVQFVGFRRKEQLQLYYQAADVFVLPTHSDVWGLVINEAMACGLPVITTDRCVAGLELVREGVNGCLVPVEDRQALVDAMHRVLLGDYAGLPVITTDRCVAGLELVREGVNGCLVPVEDRQALVDAMHRVLLGDYAGMGAAALETIRPYTLENMARVHVDFFDNEV